MADPKFESKATDASRRRLRAWQAYELGITHRDESAIVGDGK
jgi:hypothetical protein